MVAEGAARKGLSFVVGRALPCLLELAAGDAAVAADSVHEPHAAVYGLIGHGSGFVLDALGHRTARVAEGEERQADDGDGGVDEEQFETGLVASPAVEGILHAPRQARRQHAHGGHPTVVNRLLAEHSEDEQAENRAVGV